MLFVRYPSVLYAFLISPTRAAGPFHLSLPPHTLDSMSLAGNNIHYEVSGSAAFSSVKAILRLDSEHCPDVLVSNIARLLFSTPLTKKKLNSMA
jgi:hypothetical protein